MIRVKWDLTEAVVLIAEYMKASTYTDITDEELFRLSEMYKKKAQDAGIVFDEKFRNITGLRMQLACIHYIVTDGKEGMSNASKVFYQAYDLYMNEPETFNKIKDDFVSLYYE